MACQALQEADWATGAQLPKAHSEKFQGWQEITHSIFWAVETASANGSLVLLARNQGREASTRVEGPKEITPALLRSASGELCPLDKDLSWKPANRPVEVALHLSGNPVTQELRIHSALLRGLSNGILRACSLNP